MDEKKEFKAIVESFMLKTGAVGENENIEEALPNLYYCNEDANNLKTYKMEEILDVIDKTSQKELFSKSNDYMKT